MIRNALLGLALVLWVPCEVLAQDLGRFFDHSYAVVIGIDDYIDSSRPKLSYAVKDGRALAAFLREQGFTVMELYDQDATRAVVLSTLERWFVTAPSKNDRVLLFFAGHGETRPGARGERGFLVPVDGSDFPSLISTVELQSLVADSPARHQLLILDACFGGLVATKRGPIPKIDRSVPNYLIRISERPARQLLTAGGANERVLDGGPDGHSYFMGYLLRALKQGVGDKDNDGYITTTELYSYVRGAASTYGQTPVGDILEGHEGGDFWFVNPTRASNGDGVRNKTQSSELLTDVYKPLNDGRAALRSGQFAEARAFFSYAANLGSADAMNYLGRLLFEGLGGSQDRRGGLNWLHRAADRGHPGAMANLANAYLYPGPDQDIEAARRWAAAATDARAIDTTISREDSTIVAPMPPTNVTAE